MYRKTYKNEQNILASLLYINITNLQRSDERIKNYINVRRHFDYI